MIKSKFKVGDIYSLNNVICTNVVITKVGWFSVWVKFDYDKYDSLGNDSAKYSKRIFDSMFTKFRVDWIHVKEGSEK